uniref:Cytosolic carboxypeptidase NnaD n=1 Tax=Lygus hesperus TaxID=30085 RepID=A0A0A9XGP0_LYGHE
MLNPDGVACGNSRVDGNGTDLNRAYRSPSHKRHPAIFALKSLLLQLIRMNRLALYVDFHAHANKRGTFLYGNTLPMHSLAESVLYAKLVSLHTPYFNFTSCNFSESNMYAVGKAGKGKDQSSRVVLYLETGFTDAYTL